MHNKNSKYAKYNQYNIISNKKKCNTNVYTIICTFDPVLHIEHMP